LQVGFTGRTGINDDEPLPADQVRIRSRPGHWRRVGGDESPYLGVGLGESTFDD
jgi:hypothetical protein